MSSTSVQLNDAYCYTPWTIKKYIGHRKYRNIIRKTACMGGVEGSRVEHALVIKI